MAVLLMASREGERGFPVHGPQCGQQPGQHQHHGGAHEHGQGDLQKAQPEHMLAHGAQLGQVEFQPDHEHQEHHAEFAQVLHRFHVARERHGVRADQHAHAQIAQHGRQLEQPAADHPQHGSQQIQQGYLKSVHGHILASTYPRRLRL
jgi:hypothetical protein